MNSRRLVTRVIDGDPLPSGNLKHIVEVVAYEREDPVDTLPRKAADE